MIQQDPSSFKHLRVYIFYHNITKLRLCVAPYPNLSSGNPPDLPAILCKLKVNYVITLAERGNLVPSFVRKYPSAIRPGNTQELRTWIIHEFVQLEPIAKFDAVGLVQFPQIPNRDRARGRWCH